MSRRPPLLLLLGLAACRSTIGDTAEVLPTAEVCDGIDNDLDGFTDEGFDGDGNGIPDCQDDGACPGEDADGDGLGDCHDLEECDGLDNNGDGRVDEGFDVDQDGVPDCADVESCDDWLDNDGDGRVDEGCPALDCPDRPVLGCLSFAEGWARGQLVVRADGATSGLVVENHGEHPVCIDAPAFFGSPRTQSAAFGGEVVADRVAVPAGGALQLGYGSWTTENETYHPYLGLYAWWCADFDTPVRETYAFDYFGEQAPEPYWGLIAEATDVDGDGREDHADWADTQGVQTQYSLWQYQFDHAMFVVGHEVDVAGVGVTVRVIVRNFGDQDGEGEVVATLPEGFTLAAADGEAVQGVDDAGHTTLRWEVSLPGWSIGATLGQREVTDAAVYTYTMRGRVDAPRTLVPGPVTRWDDGEGERVNAALPFVFFDYDANSDGVVECSR